MEIRLDHRHAINKQDICRRCGDYISPVLRGSYCDKPAVIGAAFNANELEQLVPGLMKKLETFWAIEGWQTPHLTDSGELKLPDIVVSMRARE